jgi:hypothetical protein
MDTHLEGMEESEPVPHLVCQCDPDTAQLLVVAVRPLHRQGVLADDDTVDVGVVREIPWEGGVPVEAVIRELEDPDIEVLQGRKCIRISDKRKLYSLGEKDTFESSMISKH